MRSTYVQIAFAQVIIIGLARFGFSDTGHPPALITPAMESGQAGASIARLTNFLNAAVVAEESFKPKTALAYYEKAKLLDPSSSGFVEAVMAEYYRKYFPYEYYQMHRSGSAAQSAFMDAYRFYSDNREYEHALRLLDDPPTNRSDTHPLPLSLLREASIESMRIRPGVRNVVVLNADH